MAADPALVRLMTHTIQCRRPVYGAGPTPGPSSYELFTVRGYTERTRIIAQADRGSTDVLGHILITDQEVREGDQCKIPGVSSPEFSPVARVITFYVPYSSTEIHHYEVEF